MDGREAGSEPARRRRLTPAAPLPSSPVPSPGSLVRRRRRPAPHPRLRRSPHGSFQRHRNKTVNPPSPPPHNTQQKKRPRRLVGAGPFLSALREAAAPSPPAAGARRRLRGGGQAPLADHLLKESGPRRSGGAGCYPEVRRSTEPAAFSFAAPRQAYTAHCARSPPSSSPSCAHTSQSSQPGSRTKQPLVCASLCVCVCEWCVQI